MATNQSDNIQSLRNLAGVLRDQHRQISNEPRLPSPTDQDILRAMLGKPWKTSAAEAQPARKAG
jgi:hypothetical protein